MRIKKGYVEITDEIIKQIQSHIDRTGIAPQAALKGRILEKRQGLTSGIIYQWLNGRNKTGRKEHVSLTLKLWGDLPENPDKPKRYKNYKEGLEPISEVDLEKLKLIRDLTGILPSRILKLRDDVPKGLSSEMINKWLNTPNYKAHPENVKWVLNKCKSQLRSVLTMLDEKV
jgi:hypothetical protein